MAQAFYGIDIQGKMLLERRSSDPTAEQGRIYVRTSDNKLIACLDGATNVEIARSDGSAESARYA